MKVVTSQEMRNIEAACVRDGTSLQQLMNNAGGALADRAEVMADGGPVVILVGPGNNGGDGLVAASALLERGHTVAVYAFAREDVSPFDGRVIRSDEHATPLRELLSEASVVVDALLGIGQSRPVEGELALIVELANAARHPGCQTLAADIPTGVQADTGEILGTAFRADETLAMGFAKLGSVVYPGAGFAGRVRVTDAGIPTALADDVPRSGTDARTASHLLPQRGAEANKGSSGRLLAICGSNDFTGAPVLVSLAAYRAGAGLVELATPERIKASVSAHAVEPVYLPLSDVDGKIGPDNLDTILRAMEKAKAVAVGSGMGLSDGTIALVRELLDVLRGSNHPSVVIDADALNALSRLPNWFAGLDDLVLTPHPGEMARLTGLSIEEVQRDRLVVAGQHARKWGAVVVLKGARTVVASPNGELAINLSGGPNLATAGTGDVLTGVVGGLLAQGHSPWDAARCAAFLHGRAGDLWQAENGDVGMLASDLLTLIPVARRSILDEVEAK